MKYIITACIVVGIAARLYLAFAFYGNWDQASYEIVMNIVRHGGNVYAETSRYNYSPLWSFVLAGLSYLPIPFHAAVRSFLTLVDVAIAFVIYKITGKPAFSILFFLNPVSILITGFHGQFENLAILPLLVAVYLQKIKPSRLALFLLCTLSLLIKHITLFFVIILIFHYARSKRQAFLMLAEVGIVFVASFFPYLPAGTWGIVHNVFMYSSGDNPYGLHALLPSWSVLWFIPVMLLLAVMFSKRPIINQLLLSSLSFLIFAPGIAQEYFVIPLIFGALAPEFGYFAYALVASVFIAGRPENIHLPLPSLWNTVWFASIFWLAALVYHRYAHSARMMIGAESPRL